MATREVVYRIKVTDLASGKMRDIELAMERTGRAARTAESGTGMLNGKVAGMGKLLKGGAIAGAIVGVGRAIVGMGKEAVSAAAQVERYNATLETMLGSKAAARDRMQEYMEIAKTTPFELTEVVEAGNQLQALGRYSEETLTMLGDLAAASGKPFEQVMGAYSKMASGQKGIAIDMFRDLLITTDDWTRATGKGKAASGEMLATTEELLQALPKVMKSKGFFGLMAKQSETTEGKISNLEDAVFSLRSAVGERLTPSVKSTVDVLEEWVSSMEKAIAVPIEQKIAVEQAGLNILVERLIEANGKEEQRRSIISKLQRDYPEFLKNIDAEKASMDELRVTLKSANKEYERKIRLAVYSSKMEELQDEAADAMETIVKNETARKARETATQLKGEWNLLFGTAFRNGWGGKGDWGRDDRYGYYYVRNGKKTYLNEANQRRAAQLEAQIRGNERLASDNTGLFGNETDYKAKQKLEEAKAKMEILEELYGGEQSMDEATSSAPAPSSSSAAVVGGGITGGGSRASGTTLGGSGGGGRNVTTNIGTLVGKIEIHTTTLRQSAAEIKALMTQILTEAVNEI